MKLYDSYSQDIIEIKDSKINIYNCGPTVYNHIHIGNARPLIVFDVLYRYLTIINKDVAYLQNITDIDDKIINASIENHQKELELSNYYYQEYEKIKTALNIKPMMVEKVSDNISGMIDYIKKIIDNNCAYNINGNVYFDTSKISNYGCLSKRKLDEQIVGERVAIDDQKINNSDFVLWKKTNVGIQWDTPWGKGRPGWHTECAFLIDKYFNNHLTIHGGGIDLKFPHHENENAQNNAIHHTNLAKIWMHVGHININNEKMSKSLNNFILVKDLLNEYDANTIRWFMYKTNYANPLNFNQEIINECQNEINKINKNINVFKSYLYVFNHQFNYNQKLNDELFLNWLDDNLNIVNAIARVYELIKNANLALKQKQYLKLNELINLIINSLLILGIKFKDIHNGSNIDLLNQYFQLVEQKKFKESDEIRKELINKGLL